MHHFAVLPELCSIKKNLSSSRLICLDSARLKHYLLFFQIILNLEKSGSFTLCLDLGKGKEKGQENVRDPSRNCN